MYCAILLAGLLLPAAASAGTEVGDVCWLALRDFPTVAAQATLLRFSLTKTGNAQFTYTGLFEDGNDGTFTIIGTAGLVGSTILGSFSGSRSTGSNFKTGIWQVTLDLTLAGSAEGIRNSYDRQSQTTSTDYRHHTLTLTACP